MRKNISPTADTRQRNCAELTSEIYSITLTRTVEAFRTVKNMWGPHQQHKAK